ncbi:MAG: VanW family protein, partial [Actinomycetota bacterium]|nr:VanW family protein [Actinomycetota bacterium]
MDSWRTRAEERRSTRKRTGFMGAKDAFVSLSAWQRWALAVPTVVLGLAITLVSVDVAASAGRIHPGVVASGVKIGGLSVEAASKRLAETLPARMEQPVKVAYEGESWDLTSEDLLASPETTIAAEAAFDIGRRGEFFDIVATRAAAWFRPVRLVVPVTSDASATAAAIADIVSKIDKQPTDASIVIEGTTPSITPAVVGLRADPDVLRAEILSSLVGTDKSVNVDVEFVPVRVTDEGAKQALADVREILSGPVTVTYESKSWVFTAAEIAEWVDFRIPESTTDTAGAAASTDAPVPASSLGTEVLEAYISSDEASKTLTSRVGEAGKPAVNASFKASGGVVNIIPGQDGVGPDVISLAKEMTVVLKGGGDRSLQLRTLRVEPEITTDEARGMGIKERISSYTTTYDAGNKPRVNNIHTLADAIDHTLIAPGATFSFNGSVGPRTAAKGYQEAPAIVNGKLVPQLGGGICQVGTTVFNAVYESGFPVVERKNHSFYISHYPKGRDATVSWGGPD